MTIDDKTWELAEEQKLSQNMVEQKTRSDLLNLGYEIFTDYGVRMPSGNIILIPYTLASNLYKNNGGLN